MGAAGENIRIHQTCWGSDETDWKEKHFLQILSSLCPIPGTKEKRNFGKQSIYPNKCLTKNESHVGKETNAFYKREWTDNQ